MSGSSASTLSRTLWTKALPGTAVVLAALTLPQMSFETADADARTATLATSKQTPAADKGAAPALSAPALADEAAPPSLRAQLAPIVAPAFAANTAPEVQTAAPAAVLAAPRAALPAERQSEVARSSARLAVFDTPAYVAQVPVAPVVPAQTAAPALPSAHRMAEAVAAAAAPAVQVAQAPASSAPEKSPVAEPAPAASPPANRAFGGTRGSFAALMPNGDAAGTAEGALLATPPLAAAMRDAAPGRRDAMALFAPPAALAPAPAAPPAAAAAPAQAVAPVPAARPAAMAASAAAPVAAKAPAAAPMRAATPQTPVRPAAPAAPVRTASAAIVAPLPKAVAAAPAARRPVAAAVPAAPAGKPPRAPASAPAASAPAPAQVAALAPMPRPKPQQALPAASKPAAPQIDVKSQLLTRIDGKTAGKVDFRQTESGLQVRLGSIVELLGDRFDAGMIARIRASSARDVYLPLAQLQAQGIPISYDPVYDEFNVGQVDAKPKAGYKVHIEQISTVQQQQRRQDTAIGGPVKP